MGRAITNKTLTGKTLTGEVLAGSNLTLIISGGIAAVRGYELIRLLRQQGASLEVVLTRSAQDFVTPTAIEGLLGKSVHTDALASGQALGGQALGGQVSQVSKAQMAHLDLARNADAVIVAPATASIIGKAACGIGDDLASTVLLAASNRTPVVFCPSMNERMWHNEAVAQNISGLAERANVSIYAPTEGMLACGEFGIGRMVEPDYIARQVAGLLASHKPLAGKTALVTAGATCEPLDEVRFISNHSSGKQGVAIARELAKWGAKTTLVAGASQVDMPQGVAVERVQTARQMHKACMAWLPADIFVGVAAVADWRPKTIHKGKLASAEVASIELVKNQDILQAVAKSNNRPSLVVGFSAQVGEGMEAQAKAKLKAKGCDWLVANDVAAGDGSPEGSGEGSGEVSGVKTGFGGEAVRAWFVTSARLGGKCEAMGVQAKSVLAKELCHKMAAHFKVGDRAVGDKPSG